MSQIQKIALVTGYLDILVNCAGIVYTVMAIDADFEAVQRIFDVNLFGAMRMVHHFHDLIIPAKGTIVNIGVATDNKNLGTQILQDLLQRAPVTISVPEPTIYRACSEDPALAVTGEMVTAALKNGITRMNSWRHSCPQSDPGGLPGADSPRCRQRARGAQGPFTTRPHLRIASDAIIECCVAA